jgi:flagellar hook-associated protein 2
MASGTSNTITFTGTSRYAQDFQNVINRAVAIASLPITLLNNRISTLNSQSAALTDLDSRFSGLSDAVGAITTAMGGASFSTEVSDPSIAGATVTSGAMEGVYSIEVTSLGAYTSAMSADSGPDKVTNPTTQNLSSASNFTFTVGGSTYAINPAINSLYGLADAINGRLANVRATVVNVGSSSAPDYRLSLQSTKLGDIGIQLAANASDPEGNPVSVDLMTEQVRGSLATYKVNGSTLEAASDSRNVTIAPGLTVTMLGQSAAGHATSITLTRKSTAISDALESFIAAYNTALDGLNQQRGLSAGALSGQSVVYRLRDALNKLTGYYAPGSSIASLADLGITFDVSGKMSFDQGTFLAASFGNMDGIVSLLGDGTTSGFLKTATDAMSSVENSVTGSLKNAINSVRDEISSTNNRIGTEQAKVDQLQTRLLSQMAAADALISSMEQQYTVISNIFQAMNQASESWRNQNSLA